MPRTRCAATKLDQVYARYDAAADALTDYEPELADAQRRSLTLLHSAQQDQADLDAAQRRVQAAEDAGKTDEPSYAADKSKVADQQAAITSARGKLAGIVADRHRAAQRAARELDDAMEHDGLKDGWTDKAKRLVHHMSGFLRKLADVAGWVATICGTLALLVGWIPVIGQALAAVLGTIALVATAISLVCHLLLLFSGDGGLLDIGLDVVGLLTFGVGRAAVGGLKAGVTGLRAASRSTTMAGRVTSVIAARGGRASGAVTAALARNDLSAAARLSGIARSRLRGMVGNELGKVAGLGSGGTKYLQRMIGLSPKGVWPGTPAVRDALSLRLVLRETRDGLATVFSRDGWAQTAAALRRGVGGHALVDPELATELAQLSHLAPRGALVSSVVHGINVQLVTSYANTAVATGLDFSDKMGLLEDWRSFGTLDPVG